MRVYISEVQIYFDILFVMYWYQVQTVGRFSLLNTINGGSKKYIYLVPGFHNIS